jgi:L-iditol 2-dehydrogenase
MKAVYLHAPRDLRLHDDPVPTVTRPDDVLIKIAAVGVCGSDCHFYERGRIGRYAVEEPVILGHECSGTVVAVGDAVAHLQPGDPVTVEPGIPCRTCRRCKEGRYNICETEVTFMGTPPFHGAFREYLTWPADFVYKLPEGVSLDDGAMVEPLAVGVHAVRRGGVTPGQSAAVIGAGPIGLLAMQVAAAYGAFPVVCSDVVPDRLEFVRRLGGIPVNAAQGDPIAAVREAAGSAGADVVIETAGLAATQRQAMHMVKTGGVVVWVGMPPTDEATLPIIDQLTREYDTRSVFRYANAYLPALSLIASGKIDLATLRTHVFDLKHTEDAMKTTIEKKAEAVKVLVKP